MLLEKQITYQGKAIRTNKGIYSSEVHQGMGRKVDALHM